MRGNICDWWIVYLWYCDFICVDEWCEGWIIVLFESFESLNW